MSAARISGVGLVTPLGSSAAQTWQALLAGEFIQNHARAPLDNCEGEPRIVTLALHAAGEAILQAGWGPAQRNRADTALVIGTSKGPIDAWLGSYPRADPSRGVGELASRLAADLSMNIGPRLTLSAACSSGLHALIRAAMLLADGAARRALVIAAESSFHPLLLGCYQRLGVLAPPEAGCRPFDEQRTGFLLSEAAAAICLEQSTDKPGVYLNRFALTGDAAHLTGGDPKAVALRHALNYLMDNAAPDLIHAHGTGTEGNDAIELAAIEATLPAEASADRPSLYSHKGALGHSLGAAGGVAVVLNCLAHQNCVVPPNVRTTRPLPTTRLTLQSTTVNRWIGTSVALAAGFGGATAGVSLVSRG